MQPYDQKTAGNRFDTINRPRIVVRCEPIPNSLSELAMKQKGNHPYFLMRTSNTEFMQDT